MLMRSPPLAFACHQLQPPSNAPRTAAVARLPPQPGPFDGKITAANSST
jgi:hypothetical protein